MPVRAEGVKGQIAAEDLKVHGAGREITDQGGAIMVLGGAEEGRSSLLHRARWTEMAS